MQVKLKIEERVSITNLFNEFKGQISGLFKIIKIMGQLEISEKEKKLIELKLTPSPMGGVSFNWNREKDKGKMIDFDDSQIGILKQLITAKNTRNEITIGDKLLLQIIEKLGIKDEFNLSELPVGSKRQDIPPIKV